MTTPPGNDTPERGRFEPPEGWALSPRRSTSRFAFEISRTTKWYINDGKGTGYFAPDWNSERIAGRMRAFIWIGVVLALIILGIGGYHVQQQYAEQSSYAQLKKDGVLIPATVQSVAVEHSTDRYSSTRAQSGWDYITETSATIKYTVGDRMILGEINDYDQQKKDFPVPAWARGETLQVYADPHSPERFVLLHEYMEEDIDSTPRGVIFVLVFTGAALILPAVFIIAGVRNVRQARKL